MAKLSIDLADQIRDLERRFGLVVKEEEYDPESFGNASVVLVADDFAMRIVRDRFQIFVDLATRSLSWIDADRRLKSLGLHPNSPSPLPLDQFVGILEKEKARIINSLGESRPA